MKKKNIVLLLIIVIISLFTFACGGEEEPDEVVEVDYIMEDYNLQVDKGEIKGTLSLPKDGEASTVALIIPGSGPTDRDGNNQLAGKSHNLKMISEALLEEGIGSVRFDKRGIGQSQYLVEKEEDIVFEDYINDAIAWVNKLKSDGRFEKVVIIGHSEGALIGATATYKSKADGFVSVAGVGTSIYETLKRQLKDQSEEVYNKSLPIMDTLKEGNLYEDPPQELYALFRPSVQPYMISWFKYDPMVEIGKIDVPVLIIQGDNDIQVTVEDAELLSQGNPNGKLVIVEGMSHILKDAPRDRQENIATYNDPDLPLSKDFVRELVDFVKGI